jgi:hypothetical protein
MLKSATVSLYFLYLVTCPTANAQNHEHSGVLGDLRITLTAVRDASDEEVEHLKLRRKPGYHFVLLFFKVKNVANYPSCEPYFHYWLGVRQGYQYKGVSLSGKNMVETMRLPPTKGSAGGIRFEVRDGTQPATLKILRDKSLDDVCAHSQHRESPITGPETLRFSLRGLLAKAE